MKAFQRIKKTINQSKYAVYFFFLQSLWVRIRLFGGILLNLAYIIWNTALSLIYSDGLLLTISVFYVLLALMRYVLLRADRGGDSRLLRNAALTIGVLLLPSAVAMGAVMVYTLLRGVKRNYSPLILIPQALFLVYCLIGAIIRIARHKKEHGLSAICVDVITLTAVFFSVFNLVNYLAHVGVGHFDTRLTLIVGLFAVSAAFLSAVFLISKSKSV